MHFLSIFTMFTLYKKRKMSKTEENKQQKKKEYIEALSLTLGNISLACKKVSISRRTYYNWCSEDAEFVTDCHEIEEKNLDFAESTLLKLIKEANLTATIFFLKTKGKKRGYIERLETDELSDREPIEVTIIDPSYEGKRD